MAHFLITQKACQGECTKLRQPEWAWDLQGAFRGTLRRLLEWALKEKPRKLY